MTSKINNIPCSGCGGRLRQPFFQWEAVRLCFDCCTAFAAARNALTNEMERVSLAAGEMMNKEFPASEGEGEELR
jgi:hypothetical protein